MSLKEQSRKLSGTIQKWVSDFLDAPDDASIFSNHKLFDELHNLFHRGHNYSGICEVCNYISRNFTKFSKNKELFIYSLIPIVIESYVIHGIITDTKHDQFQMKHDSVSASVKQEAAKAFSCVENFIYCLIGGHREESFSGSLSGLGLYSNLYTSVPLNRIFNTDRKTINNVDENNYDAKKNPIRLISSLVDMYKLAFIDQIGQISKLNFPYDSTKHMFVVLSKIFSLTGRYCAMHDPRLMKKGIEFIDFFLMKLSHQTETPDITEVRGISMEVLLNIEMTATYYCYADVLLLCNSVKSLCIKKYGEISLSDQKGFQSRPVSAWRMSTIDESGVLNELDQSNYSEDFEQGYKLSKGKGIMTNASFKPEILPEDISVE